MGIYMRKADAEKVLTVLEKIKNPDARVEECILIVKKQLTIFEQQRGQLRDNYEYNWLY